MIPSEELAWLAGAIDARGRVVRKKNRTRAASDQLTLTLQSPDKGFIQVAADMTGTTVESMAPKNSYRWGITGAAMYVVLHNVEPYLVVDRDYEALSEQIRASTPVTGNGASAVLHCLNRLEELGWNIPEHYQIAIASRVKPLHSKVQVTPS